MSKSRMARKGRGNTGSKQPNSEKKARRGKGKDLKIRGVILRTQEKVLALSKRKVTVTLGQEE